METEDLQTRTFRIDGMTCVNCQNRIEKKLKSTAGVCDASVSYESGTATVTYNASEITLTDIKKAVVSLGYQAVEPGSPAGRNRLTQIAGTLVIIIALYMLFRMFSTSSLATAFPVAQAGMGYGMVLIIGLITSVHCIAMCGGINLSQTLKKGNGDSNSDNGIASGLYPDSSNNNPQSLVPSPQSLLYPAILYNAGRLISYTAVGVVVGALGSVITVSGRFQGAVLLIA
jgi:sulfite exporter TauE/SafE